MSGARTVFVSVAVSMTIFMLAGGRFEKVVAKLGGPNSAAANAEKAQAAETIGRTFVAWAFIFITLAIMADFQSTARIAEAFALLIMLTVILAYGVDAFGAVSDYVGGNRGGPPVQDGTENIGSNRSPRVE